MKPRDRQVGGDHYLNMGLQPWDALQAWQSHEEYEGYQIGTAVAYLARWRHKGGLNDIKKAIHHLQELVDYVGKRDIDHIKQQEDLRVTY